MKTSTSHQPKSSGNAQQNTLVGRLLAPKAHIVVTIPGGGAGKEQDLWSKEVGLILNPATC